MDPAWPCCGAGTIDDVAYRELEAWAFESDDDEDAGDEEWLEFCA